MAMSEAKTHQAVPSILVGQTVLQRLTQLERRLGPGARIALYGNGQHTTWLLELLRHLPTTLNIKVIYDDHPEVSPKRPGIPVRRPSRASHLRLDAIIPSSDSSESRLVACVRKSCPPHIPIFRLYAGLPPGPYGKPDPTLPRLGILVAAMKVDRALLSSLTSIQKQPCFNRAVGILLPRTATGIRDIRRRFPTVEVLRRPVHDTGKTTRAWLLRHRVEVMGVLKPGDLYEEGAFEKISLLFRDHPDTHWLLSPCRVMKGNTCTHVYPNASRSSRDLLDWWTLDQNLYASSGVFFRLCSALPPPLFSEGDACTMVYRMAVAFSNTKRLTYIHDFLATRSAPQDLDWDNLPPPIRRRAEIACANSAQHSPAGSQRKTLSRLILNEVPKGISIRTHRRRSVSSPLISIITPAFNSLKYLPRALYSARIQSGTSFEHLVIDGDSTDGTKEYLKRQPDIRWISEPDSGAYHALNKGLRMARGKWVVVLNADDYLEPGIFRKIAGLVATHPDARFIFGHLRVLHNGRPPFYNRPVRTGWSTLLRWWEPDTYPWNGLSYYVRRDLAVQLGGYNEKYRAAADVDFVYRARVLAPFLTLPSIFGTWHMRNDTITSRSWLHSGAREKCRIVEQFAGRLVPSARQQILRDQKDYLRSRLPISRHLQPGREHRFPRQTPGLPLDRGN